MYATVLRDGRAALPYDVVEKFPLFVGVDVPDDPCKSILPQSERFFDIFFIDFAFIKCYNKAKARERDEKGLYLYRRCLQG